MLENKLQIDVFKGKEASVNSYIFHNGTSQIVVDVLRNSQEAKELAELIQNKKLPLTHILITHGHPDHYIGLDIMSKTFPEAKIVVASKEIKADIIGFSTWMESVGWLEGEVNMKPKTDTNPVGFDYEGKINVLDSKELTLLGGGTLQIENNYASAEAEHLTTIFSEDLNAFFTADFCYNGVHLWLGQGVDVAHITNWKKQLLDFKKIYSNISVTIYPGHGEKATPVLFDEVLTYLNAFEKAVHESNSKEAIIEKMKNLYPTWEQADFLLLYSADYHFSLKS